MLGIITGFTNGTHAENFPHYHSPELNGHYKKKMKSPMEPHHF